MTAMTRAAAIEAGAIALAGVAVGGVVLGEHADPALSRPSATQDAEILNFALLLEYVQSAFYAEALQRADLTGELLTFATMVGFHERAHLDLLRETLGGAARKPPKLDFGDDTADAGRFGIAALKLEDLSVARTTPRRPISRMRHWPPPHASSPWKPATLPGSAICKVRCPRPRRPSRRCRRSA